MLPTSIPKYRHQTAGQLRAAVLAAGLDLVALGERVTVTHLRELGCRGGTNRLRSVRDDLIADGELPETARPRDYQRVAPLRCDQVRPPQPSPAVCLPRPERRGDDDEGKPLSEMERSIRLYGRARIRREYRRTRPPKGGPP